MFDISVELEAERLKALKLSDRVNIAESSSCKALGFKCKRGHKNNQKGKGYASDQRKPNVKKHLKGKCTDKKKKDNSKMRCYNCSKLGHFAHEYTELKKVRSNSTLLNALIMSYVLLTESRLVWPVHSRATEHITRDRDTFTTRKMVFSDIEIVSLSTFGNTC